MEQQKREQGDVKQFTSAASKPGLEDSSSSSPPTRGTQALCEKLSGLNECGGNERVKRQRSEVVVVPDKWSQEEMLKDWLDFASFDALLAPKGFDLARAALVAERRQHKEQGSNKAYIGMHYSATRCS